MQNSKLATLKAMTLLAGSALVTDMATAKSGWTAVSEIVGQTSTATIAGGGDPIYIAPKPQFSGSVGLRMDYGAAGAFVCSGTLINSVTVVTAAHCVSDGGTERPLSTTVFFYDGADDPSLYAAGSPATRIAVSNIIVNPLYSGEVVDQNDIAILKLSQVAPSFAPYVALSDLADLTSIDHTVAGYGARSISGGTNGTLTGFSAGTGRLRFAENRFDFRFGDADFEGYFNGAFGPQSIDHVWISDFDNGTAFRDGSCNVGIFEGLVNPIFSSSKYCDLGRGASEGIGAGGDSGGSYYVDGKLAAVHSFALWYRDDESANRFGQLKGAVPIYFHRDFITANAVPEPATWGMMIAGFGLVGAAARRNRRNALPAKLRAA